MKTRRLVGRWICSNRVTDVMGCVVPLCFPPVCMDMCICTNHDLDWTFHPMAPRKVASHCHHHKIHRFRVNTETLLKPVLQESSALGDYTAPKQYLKLNGHFSPHGYGTRCDGESRTHSFRCPQLASATRKPAATDLQPIAASPQRRTTTTTTTRVESENRKRITKSNLRDVFSGLEVTIVSDKTKSKGRSSLRGNRPLFGWVHS